jgi:glycosyltransferase involved in cell wall biosynthesis
VNPRVSVIIPYYNTAELVTETLDSVLAQTYRDFEVILVNDGSPDTAELERVLQPYLDKITYIRKENGGVSSARNRAIGAARGELIALIDSDDLWVPEYLAFQVAQLDADPQADIVYPNAVFFGIGENGRKLSRVLTTPIREVTFTSLITEECSVVTSVVARKQALVRAGLYDEKLRRCEDFDLWLRCVKAGGRIIFHNKVLLRYRRRPGSLSADLAAMAGHAATVLRKARATMVLTDDERAAIERKLARFDGERLFQEGKQDFLGGDYATAISKLEAANRHLKSGRISRFLLLLRVAPGLTRKAHAWLDGNRDRNRPNS